ncbi:MAG: flagellar basal body rod protein FlgB [Proteobacteria bacterium]|nr:flagellar basal body rod protein FlgB [Pseudomonadota bacterium]
MFRIIIVAVFMIFSVSVQAGGLKSSLNDRMNYLIARQSLVSSNIANSSTPNYLAKDIKFKSNNTSGGLKMRATSGKHIRMGRNSFAKYKMQEDKTFIRNDGNSVRLDDQMMKLAKIQQEYNLATKIYAKHMAMQKLAIQSK